MKKFDNKKEINMNQEKNTLNTTQNKLEKIHEGFVGDGMMMSATGAHLTSGIITTLTGAELITIDIISQYNTNLFSITPIFAAYALTSVGLLCTSAPLVEKIVWTVYNKKLNKKKVLHQKTKQREQNLQH